MALDGEITAGVQDGFVAVVKPDVVRRGSVRAADFQDFAVPVRGLYGTAPDNDAVSLGCLHGNHLPALGYGFRPFCGTGSRPRELASVPSGLTSRMQDAERRPGPGFKPSLRNPLPADGTRAVRTRCDPVQRCFDLGKARAALVH